MMAIQTEPNAGGEENEATLAPSSPEATPKAADGSSTPVSNRSGGPRTPKGKRRSSRNATKHGVFSKSPVISDEREEDWIAHFEGYRESFQPQGRDEEIHVGQMALNRWQRLREERWMAEKLQLQFEAIDHRSRQSIDPAMMDLPEDEAAWWDSSPVAAMLVVNLLDGSDQDVIVPAKTACSFMLAYQRFRGSVEHVLGPIHPTGSAFQEPMPALPDPSAVTVGQLRGWVELAAQTTGLSERLVLAGIEAEIGRAFLHQQLRQNDDRRRDEILRADALVLTSADSHDHERRVNFLDKEYDRLVNRLEVSQRARTGAALPPPVRLHRSTE